MTTVYQKFNIRTTQTPAELVIAAGKNRYLQQNCMLDVKPPQALNSLRNIFDQSTPTFLPNLGTYGSWWMYGGGHSGYVGNEVYIFDLATRLWSAVTTPYPIPQASIDLESWWTDPANIDQVWGDTPNGAWFGHSPVTTHTRSSVVVLPGGTNNKGRVFIPYASDYKGIVYDGNSHIYDAGVVNPTRDPAIAHWSRTANIGPIQGPNGDAWWYDSARGEVRGIVNLAAPTQAPVYRFDVPTLSWVANHAVSPAIPGRADMSHEWLDDRKLLYLMHSNNTSVLHLYAVDFSGNTPYPWAECTLSGPTMAAIAGASPRFCPLDGKFYLWHCSAILANSGTMYRITPSVDPRNLANTNAQLLAATYTVEDITSQITADALLGGVFYGGTLEWQADNAPGGVWRVYNGMKWISALNAFGYYFGVGNTPGTRDFAPFNFWRPPGT